MQIFITYTLTDHEFAEYLADRLGQMGVPISWAHPDDKLSAWQEAFELSDIVIIVLSPAALDDQGVLNDWRVALETRRPVIAAFVDPCFPDIPINRYADFTTNPDRAFNRLMHLLVDQVDRLRNRF
jgi:hypothetical protein